MYICVCMYFIFTENFPIFACISIFERGRARTRVHALFVRSMRSITMRTKGYRRVESKIMQKLYNSMFPLFLLILFFILFFFRSRGHLRRPANAIYVVQLNRINWRIIMQRGRFKDKDFIHDRNINFQSRELRVSAGKSIGKKQRIKVL